MLVVVWLVIISALFASNRYRGQRVVRSDDALVLPDGFYAVGLVYHRFGDVRYPSTNTSLDNFEAHLRYLTQNEFATYTVSDLYANPIDSVKKIFITIDDGLKSFYLNGWPLLKKYKCKATLFVNTESVGWGDYLTWSQLKELAAAGVEIGAHSHAHPYFLNMPHSERLSFFKADLDVSEKLFRDSLGFIPKVYAYPYGEFDEQMAQLLKEKGYVMAFAQNSGVWSKSVHSFAIPRFPVAGKYVDMSSFKAKVNMKPLVVKESSLFPIELKPREPLLLKLPLDSVQNVHGLNGFFNNAPNSTMYSIKEDTIFVQLKMPENARRVLLTFTAKDKQNAWCWWSKLFINTSFTE